MPPTKSEPATAPEIGKVNVCARQCGGCIFGPTPVIPWGGVGGGEQLVQAAVAQQQTIKCHEWTNVICRGFFNRHGLSLWYLRMARRNFNYVRKETSVESAGEAQGVRVHAGDLPLSGGDHPVVRPGRKSRRPGAHRH